MKNFDIQQICNYIIIIGTAYFMILKIIDSFAKPGSKFKLKQKEKEKARLKEVLEEILPKYLDEHDINVRDKYILQIKQEVSEETNNTLKEIKEMNNNQSQQLARLEQRIDILAQSSRDLLRQKILAIYNKNKKCKSLTENDKDNLDSLYGDYKAVNGSTVNENGYIEKIYNRMEKWKIIEDDYID